ncbi:hypothetical protein [Streptomyces sp. NPDC002205]|uniref:hypothetical protein n=1 Tax=Streptomyces sp. NPDC002205 TaxID=3154411 RepID=UPI0033301A22
MGDQEHAAPAEQGAGVRLVDQALLEERVARLPRGEAYVLEVVHRKRLLHGDHLRDGGGVAVPP